MTSLIIAAAAAYMSHGGCLQIPRDRILPGDLAGALPAFSAATLSEDMIGWTPEPGTRRVLPGRELLRRARAKGIAMADDAAHDVCVEREAQPLTEAMLADALRRVPEMAGVEMEIVEFSRVRVPAGQLEFSLTALARPPASAEQTPVLWRGRFLYDERRTMQVWARVRLTRAVQRVRAVKDIPAGSEIAADAVELAEVREFPVRNEHAVVSLEDTVGKRAVHAIRTGQTVLASVLGEPQLIVAGQRVQVTVQSGGVHLSFEREAASAGQLGSTILLRDRSSGKVLRAETVGRGAAVIHVSGENRI
jgi:flagella basal body P-ring formation protein FlgA